MAAIEIEGNSLNSFGFVDEDFVVSGMALNTFGFISGFNDIWTLIDTPVSTIWTIIDT